MTFKTKVHRSQIQSSLCKAILALTLTALGFLMVSTLAQAGSKKQPRGDYIVGDSAQSLYGNLVQNANLTWNEPINGAGWDCNNTPGLSKNLSQFGLVQKAAIMGDDSRRPLPYGNNRTKIDEMFYGVGTFFYMGDDGGCKNLRGKRCKTSGHLVIDRDMVITTAHTFRDDATGQRLSDEQIKNFRYYVKVWVPKALRKKQSVEYEFREFEIEEVQFGNHDEYKYAQKDYAFVKLKERVGEMVGPTDNQGREDKRRKQKIPKNRQVQPLPFKKFDRSKVPNVVMTAAFQADKEWVAQKNKDPFKIYEVPKTGHVLNDYPGTIIFDGDSNGSSSGSAIAMLVDGKPHFAGVAAGYYPEKTSFYGEFDLYERFNWGIDSNAIYDEFITFRSKWGR